MSLMELFSIGNTGNTDKKTGVTDLGHATQGGNTGNTGNTGKTITETQIHMISNAESPPTLQGFNYRVTDKPESELTICTTDSLTEVKEGLINRYGISVTCYTPNGDPIQLEARDEEHTAWLKRTNPKPMQE